MGDHCCRDYYSDAYYDGGHQGGYVNPGYGHQSTYNSGYGHGGGGYGYNTYDSYGGHHWWDCFCCS